MLSKESYQETTFSFSEDAPEPPERRDEPRYLTILRVGALVGPEGRELCLIRNISAGGMMAHVYSPRQAGDRVEVELKSNRPIAGSIVWVEESNVGIKFDAPIEVEEMLQDQSSLDNGWQARPPRMEVDRLATLRVGASIYGVNTRDISQGGVKIETDEPLEPGSEVVLTLEGFGALHGIVRWYHGGQAGIAFNQVIPSQQLMTWLRSPRAAGCG